MSERIGTTLSRLLVSILESIGARESASMYIGCPIDPMSLPIDLTSASRFSVALRSDV